jgi:hypothetical protein
MTITQLNAPADLLANAAATILRADAPVAFPFPVYTPREFAQQNINRVEIAATGFARASDHMDLANVANVQTPFYNHHRGQLVTLDQGLHELARGTKYANSLLVL